MRVVVSRLAPTGHLLIARLPEGAVFAASFLDDGSLRDLTPQVADLLLSGVLDALEVQQSGRQEPQETVEAVTVTYTESGALPGVVRQPASFSLAVPSTGEGLDLDPSQVLPLLLRGLTVEITTAVATEAAEVPDSPEGLDGTPQ